MFQFLRLFRRQGPNGSLRPVDPELSSESACESTNGSDVGYDGESGSVDNYDPSASVLYTDTASSWADTADIITQEEYEEGLERELQMHLGGESERPTTEGGGEIALPNAHTTEQEVQQDTASPPDANSHYTEMDISNTQMARVLSAYRNRERIVMQSGRAGQGRRSGKVNGPGGNSIDGTTRSAGTSTPHRRKRHHTAPEQAPAAVPPPEMEALDCDALDEKWFRILKGFSRRSYRINGSFFHTAVRQWPGPTLRGRPHSQH